MRYKVTLYFNNKKISKGVFDVDLLQFPRREGRTYTDDGFKIVYKMLNTKENKRELNSILEKYPTPESLPKTI